VCPGERDVPPGPRWWCEVEAQSFDEFFRFVKYKNVFSQLRRLKQFMHGMLKCIDGGYPVE